MIILISEIDDPNIIDSGIREKNIKRDFSKYLFCIYCFLNFLQAILLDL